MDFVSILASIILFTTIATLVVALAAYAAYKIRERRRPKGKAVAQLSGENIEFIFLERYIPARPETQQRS